MSTEIADVLDKAAEHIETYGWVQGLYAVNNAADKPCCLMGALAVATTGTPLASYAEDPADYFRYREAVGIVRMHLNGMVPNIWNDLPRMTAERVINKLREIARIQREES